MQVKAHPFPNEVLFMGLLFMQQKAITSFAKEIKRLARLDT